jgi:hypothetical protein
LTRLNRRKVRPAHGNQAVSEPQRLSVLSFDHLGLRGGREPVEEAVEERNRFRERVIRHRQIGDVDLGHGAAGWHDKRPSAPSARRVDGESRHQLTRAKLRFVVTLLRLPAANHPERDGGGPLAAPDRQLQGSYSVDRRNQTQHSCVQRLGGEQCAFDLPRLVDLSSGSVDHDHELLTDGGEERLPGRPRQSADVARDSELDQAERAKRPQVDKIDLAVLAAGDRKGPSVGRGGD